MFSMFVGIEGLGDLYLQLLQQLLTIYITCLLWIYPRQVSSQRDEEPTSRRREQHMQPQDERIIHKYYCTSIPQSDATKHTEDTKTTPCAHGR